jgi:SSS family solute:Na+ symporter
LPGFNSPPEFNFVGVFWQDGMVGGVAFYFMHQGMIMRFLATRSVSEGRRAAVVLMLVLMPLAAISVAGAGWVGTGLVAEGDLAAETPAKEIFVHVAHFLSRPGFFGLIMAAMAAALMSTTDTLINASSAIIINDVYRPWRRWKGRKDDPRRELRMARLASLLAASIGVSLVPIFAAQDSIYAAHGAFTAAVTPPMAVALILGAFWRRFTAAGALATLVGGTALMFVSLKLPVLVTPFAHGTVGEYIFIRAFFGVVVSTGIGVGVSLFTRPRPAEEVVGLTWDTLKTARDRFKGGKSRDDGGGPKVPSVVRVLAGGAGDDPPPVGLAEETLRKLRASEGDVIFVDDGRWWMGGLRSVRGRAILSPARRDEVWIPKEEIERNRWASGKKVVLQRVL